jgi:hypothetical protein
MAFQRALHDDARAIAARERFRDRIDCDDKHASKLPDRAYGFEHILKHGRCEQSTFIRA